MGFSWRKRLAQQPELADISQWPPVDIQQFSPTKKKQFQRNLVIVAKSLEGSRSLSDIAAEHQISPSRVTTILDRCLGGIEEEPPALCQGLIPGKRLKKNTRRSPLNTLTDRRGGACSFRYLLDCVPGLKDYLDKVIQKSVSRESRGQNLKPQSFHAAFIRYLEEQNWPRDSYPYTESLRGYESLRKYLKLRSTEFAMPNPPKRTIIGRSAPHRVFSEIQIDEQIVDSHSSIVLSLNGQLEPLRVSRITLLQARDAATGCTLAFTIALTNSPGADDILSLIEQLTQRWEPLELTTPGLCYEPEAKLPSALQTSFRHPAFGIVRMDNALSHLAHQVRHTVCDKLGATLNFGLPAQPKSRNVIEQAFALLNRVTHRFASTTGSHVKDPDRETSENQRKAPALELRSLEEAISVVVTGNNARAVANLGGSSPLHEVAYQMANHLLPLRPVSPNNQLRPFWSNKVVKIRGAKDNRFSPRINFEKVTYRGEGINKAELLNQEVSIHFDRRDIRTLYVYSLDGNALGTVTAPKTWQRYAHSLVTRKYINRLVRKGRLQSRDPLGEYFDHLLASRHNPKDARELIRVYREFGEHTTPQSCEVHSSKNEENLDRPLEKNLNAALKRIPDWQPEMVKKRNQCS